MTQRNNESHQHLELISSTRTSLESVTARQTDHRINLSKCVLMGLLLLGFDTLQASLQSALHFLPKSLLLFPNHHLQEDSVIIEDNQIVFSPLVE